MPPCKHGHPTPCGRKSHCPQCHTEASQKFYRKTKRVEPVRHRMKSIIINMRRRRECTVTINDLVELWEQQEGKCSYCDIEMTVDSGGRVPTTVSVDRIDQAVPYHLDNIVLSCWLCNAAKGTATRGRFIEWAIRIARKYQESI